MSANEEPSHFVIEGCIERLASPDPEEREAAAGKLGFFGGEAASAIPKLKEALDDPVKEVRYTAGIALGAILEALSDSIEPAKSVLQTLGRLFDDDSEESRREVIAAIERLEDALGELPKRWPAIHSLSESILTNNENCETSLLDSAPHDLVTDDTMTTNTTELTAPNGFHRRALFAFNALATQEQAQVLDTLARISGMAQCDWPASCARKLPGEQSDYLIRVNDSLRVIIEARESGQLVVLDLVRHDTLRTFGALQDV
jgi:hypothetical protein